MRLASHSIRRRTIFWERPARGGSITTTSGLPASSMRGRRPVRALPTRKWAFSIPLRSALRSASAIAPTDELEAPDLAGVAGEGEADRADAAVEVEDALGAGEAGELGGDPVEALGHLGVRLKERAVGDLEVEPAELLRDRLGAKGAGRALGRSRSSFDHGVEVDGRALDRSRRRDEARLQVAGAQALADDEVAQDAVAAAAVQRGNLVGDGPAAHLVAGVVAALGGEVAVVDTDDAVPAAAGVEAEGEAGIGGAEGVFELVAVAPFGHGGDDRIELEGVEAADAAQGLVDLALLLGKLALVREALPRRAGAGLTVVDADVGPALGAGAEDLGGGCFGEVLLGAVTRALTRSPGRPPDTKTT